MADEKIPIRVNINGEYYSANIAPEKEAVYRRAAAEVNAYFTKLKPKLPKDIDAMALTALNFAIDKINLQRSREVGDEDMQALNRIDQRLDNYLNTPDGAE